MADEQAVKSVLVMAHALLDKVRDNGEAICRYWVAAKVLKPGEPERQVLLVKMDALSKKSTEMIPKASALLSALSASQEDLLVRNAVLMNAFKALSEACVALYTMHERVLDIEGPQEAQE